MSYLLTLYRDAELTLATTEPVLPPDQLAPLQDALAERAFDHVVPPQPVRLKLPPALVEPVRAELARRELPLPVQCAPDAQLHGLQCTIESQAGVLIAGLDEVLARTAQSLELSQRAHAAPEAVR